MFWASRKARKLYHKVCIILHNIAFFDILYCYCIFIVILFICKNYDLMANSPRCQIVNYLWTNLCTVKSHLRPIKKIQRNHAFQIMQIFGFQIDIQTLQAGNCMTATELMIKRLAVSNCLTPLKTGQLLLKVGLNMFNK